MGKLPIESLPPRPLSERRGEEDPRKGADSTAGARSSAKKAKLHRHRPPHPPSAITDQRPVRSSEYQVAVSRQMQS
eukprot:scaffold5596_cov132-Skeletonema_dohrnii-CCMP3373.AAC.3